MPTYTHDDRIQILRSHAQALLKRQRVNFRCVNLVVASAAECAKYAATLGRQAPKILVAEPGVVNVWAWISRRFATDTHVAT